MNLEEKLANYGPGPWVDEVDELFWRIPEVDLACCILRGPLGTWCGYVGLDSSHPYYKKGWAVVTEKIMVHGGVTFASTFSSPPLPATIKNLWWIGFDCGHFNDLVPGIVHLYPDLTINTNAIYKDTKYVIKETNSLAQQLKEIVPIPSNLVI